MGPTLGPPVDRYARRRAAGKEFANAITGYFQKQAEKEEEEIENEALEKAYGINLKGTKGKTRQEILKHELAGRLKESEYGLKQESEKNKFNEKSNLIKEQYGTSPQQKGRQLIQGEERREPDPFVLEKLEESGHPLNPQMVDELAVPQEEDGTFSDAQIALNALIDPNVARIMQQQKDAKRKESTAKEKEKTKAFESERAYHTSFSKKQEEEAEGLRSSLPKKENALHFARDAIESGETDYFSLNKLADITGIDLFRTSKGAQLNTAAKENLLSNMGRVSARAQNVWFEQRLNSQFPKIGQSKEANLTVQEMLEGEIDLEKAYLNEFDRISDQDQKEYGFVRKDASKRAREASKHKEKEIFNRTNYRLKDIEEQEKSADTLKHKVGKNVLKGTPLTARMAKLYKKKFGENALNVAEKNGYHVPTYEEYKLFQLTPLEYRGE